MSEKLAELKKRGGNGSGSEMPFLVAMNYGAHLYFLSGDGGKTDGYGGYIQYNNNFSFSGTIPNVGVVKWNSGTLRIVPTKAVKAYILESSIGAGAQQALINRTTKDLTANANNDISLVNAHSMHILFE